MMMYDSTKEHWPVGRMRDVHCEFTKDIMVRFTKTKTCMWRRERGVAGEELFGSKVLKAKVANHHYH